MVKSNQKVLKGQLLECVSEYSGDPKTGHSNTGNIWKLDILGSGFRMAGLHAYLLLEPTIWCPTIQKPD